MTDEQQRIINERIYTPVWREQVAARTGIRFETPEEDLMARQMVEQFKQASYMRKQANYSQNVQRGRQLKGALYAHMNKLASYASGTATPMERNVYDELRQVVSDPKLADALRSMEI